MIVSDTIATVAAIEPAADQLKALVLRARAANAILDEVPNLWESSSIADKTTELNTKICAPAEIVCWPRGYQCAIRPMGATQPVSFLVDDSWAKLFNRHLQAMRAGGQRPYFDFFHKPDCGKSGWPNEFFWDSQRGVCCFVEWTAAAEQLILAGDCNSFSPTWSHMGVKNDLPLGLPLCCGALLHNGLRPALQRMPSIEPQLLKHVMKLKKKRFFERVETRLPEFKASGSEFYLIEVFASVAKDYLDLYQAYQLFKAMADEFQKDSEAAYS